MIAHTYEGHQGQLTYSTC